VLSAFSIIVRLAWNLLQWCGLLLRPRESLEAEILFLRRQLALYRERGVKAEGGDAATPSHIDPSVALVRLAICIGDCPA
jgi:hypothetical protein